MSVSEETALQLRDTAVDAGSLSPGAGRPDAMAAATRPAKKGAANDVPLHTAKRLA